MFKDEKTGVTIYAPLGSTLIRATHRPQDLVPAFFEALKETPEYVQLMNYVPDSAWRDEDNEWWDSEDCTHLLTEELWDVLDSYSPEGFFFGCDFGDGSDFGYWKTSFDDVFGLTL